MQPISEDYLIPIVIGVTGRKGSPPDEERISALILPEMVRLRNTFPSSPFIVISSLSGSDECLLARLAIEHLRARLIAVLPYPPGQDKNAPPDGKYGKDFGELLGRAESSIDIPSLMMSKLGGARYGSAEDPAMSEIFTAAFIAEHSEILFAVSSGDGTGDQDTTARIIKWIREGRITREYSLRVNKSGLDTADRSMIISIDPVALRTKTESVPPEEYSVPAVPGSGIEPGFPGAIYRAATRKLFALIQSVSHLLDKLYDSLFKPSGADITDGYEKSPFTGIMERVDGFNSDVRIYIDKYGDGDLAKSKQYLLQNESGNELISGDGALRKIICLYSASDVLSQFYQKKTARLISWIYVLFFAAVVLYGLIDWSSYLVLCYIGLIPAIALLVKKTSRDRIEDRFLDYRALAEGLRVQFFWTLSGIDENVSSHYLSKYEGLLTWIRKAVRSIEIITLRTGNAEHAPGNNTFLNITRKLWIESQLDYFGSKKRPLLTRSQQFGYIMFLSFVLTLLVALVYGMFVLFAGVGNSEAINNFQILLGVIAAVGVAAQAYKNKRAYDELERRYSLAQQTYASAKRELEIGEVPPERILIAVGREALLENSDWLWTHRNVPIEVPKG
ncbi:MAG TPA: hypothetical protein VLG45_05035 [Thermodesulfobacteriota bacterium]|nr:hypothetical protein [Thermodesulfobacteriota bacterium]